MLELISYQSQQKRGRCHYTGLFSYCQLAKLLGFKPTSRMTSEIGRFD
jgi:hypothetical protein